jgi:hypothetical protein
MTQYRQSGAIEPFEALHGTIRLKLFRVGQWRCNQRFPKSGGFD